MEELLPIGSIVTLKNGGQKLMIISRAALYNNQGTLGYFEYSSCIYPFGHTNQNAFFFNSEDIEEVVFRGYEDDDEKKYQELYQKKMQEISYPKLHLEMMKVESGN